jgi:hypothetical protein
MHAPPSLPHADAPPLDTHPPSAPQQAPAPHPPSTHVPVQMPPAQVGVSPVQAVHQPLVPQAGPASPPTQDPALLQQPPLHSAIASGLQVGPQVPLAGLQACPPTQSIGPMQLGELSFASWAPSESRPASAGWRPSSVASSLPHVAHDPSCVRPHPTSPRSPNATARAMGAITHARRNLPVCRPTSSVYQAKVARHRKHRLSGWFQCGAAGAQSSGWVDDGTVDG